MIIPETHEPRNCYGRPRVYWFSVKWSFRLDARQDPFVIDRFIQVPVSSRKHRNQRPVIFARI